MRFAERYELPLALLPFAAGIGTAIPLWGSKAPDIFFSTAAEVIALGAVAVALEGRLFRVDAVMGDRRRRYATLSRITVLVAVVVGLGFAFGALIRDEPAASHVPLTAGALAMGVATIGVQAFFGEPTEEATEVTARRSGGV